MTPAGAVHTGRDLDRQELSAFLKQDETSLHYLSPEYLSLLEEYLQPTKQELLRVYSGTTLRGYLPLVFRLNERLGNVCNSLPYYGSNGGIVTDRALSAAERDEVRTQLLDRAQALIEEYDCVSSTIITNPLDPGTGDWIRDHFRHDLVGERIGQLTSLPEPGSDVEGRLVKSFDDPRPRNIRHAINEGVRVHHSHAPDDLDFLVDVHRDNITSIGGIAKERGFFRLIPRHFGPERYRIYVAVLNGAKIAALLLFYFNRTVEYYTPAVVESYRRLQPTALIIYQAMVDAVREHYRWWNWGGTWMSQQGLYDFKKRWGTRDYSYFYYTRIRDDSILQQSRDELQREYPFMFVAPFDTLKPVR